MNLWGLPSKGYIVNCNRCMQFDRNKRQPPRSRQFACDCYSLTTFTLPPIGGPSRGLSARRIAAIVKLNIVLSNSSLISAIHFVVQRRTVLRILILRWNSPTFAELLVVLLAQSRRTFDDIRTRPKYSLQVCYCC